MTAFLISILRFPQILSLFSWKILCLLNPALEIPLYLSKATRHLYLELFFLHYHFDVVFPDFLIAWSACYFCFVLEHKWKELLIGHGI